MNKFELNIPVVFITFNRLDTVKRVFEQIKAAQPDKLYLISDGARADRAGEADSVDKVREYIETGVCWPCEVVKIYSEYNMGCRKRIASGLDKVFETEEAAIIIEDDIYPHDSFFEFCQNMLEWYRYDERVGMITGCNLCPEHTVDKPYSFSKIPEIWGWATWKRVWKRYRAELSDSEVQDTGNSRYLHNYFGKLYGGIIYKGLRNVQLGRISAWSYHYIYMLAKNNQLCIFPQKNLINNIGFERDDATNTKGRSRYIFPEGELDFPIEKRDDCSVDYQYDCMYIRNYHHENILQFMYSFIVSHYLDMKKDIELKKVRRS